MTSGTPDHPRTTAVLAACVLTAAAIPPAAGLGARATAVPAQAPAALEGSVDAGEQLYRDYTCYGCHGYTGETGRGPRLNPPRLRQARFIAYLRNPPNPRQMPPYRQADVSDQKLADIYAFLRSLPSASPEAEDVPVLRELLRETQRQSAPGAPDSR
jgi:mono/diheme cytochrome c family protein